MTDVTRRGFLAGSAAAVVAPSLPVHATPAQTVVHTTTERGVVRYVVSAGSGIWKQQPCSDDYDWPFPRPQTGE